MSSGPAAQALITAIGQMRAGLRQDMPNVIKLEAMMYERGIEVDVASMLVGMMAFGFAATGLDIFQFSEQMPGLFDSFVKELQALAREVR